MQLIFKEKISQIYLEYVKASLSKNLENIRLKSLKENSSRQIGVRIDLTFKIAQLAIEDFCARHNIPRSTLFAWKNGNKRLTRKGAERLEKAFESENILCSSIWLLDGTGLPPRTFEEVKQGVSPILGYYKAGEEFDETLDEEIKVLKEIEFFRKIHDNGEILLVTDDGMAPLVVPGDYVAGLTVTEENITTAFNKPCIVRLSSDQTLIRHFSKGSKPDVYTLSCSNPLTTAQSPTLFDVKIKAVAPVLWIRYKQHRDKKTL